MGLLVNLGAGTDIRDGWVNLDLEDGPGIDVVADLEQPLPFADDSVEHYLAIDVVEHIRDVYGFFSELWRCAAPDCIIEAALPYGSSDDAWTDPTHQRPFFLDSWTYFAQPHYYRMNYPYRADWQPVTVILDVDAFDDEDDGDILERVMRDRNVVSRMYVALHAVKPARPRDPDLRSRPNVKFRKVAV